MGINVALECLRTVFADTDFGIPGSMFGKLERKRGHQNEERSSVRSIFANKNHDPADRID